MLSRRTILTGVVAAAIATTAKTALADPKKSDTSVTNEFLEAQKRFPWLTDIKKSIGQVLVTEKNKVVGAGTLVLIDNEGTAILCGHEILKDSSLAVFFSTEPNKVPFESRNASLLTNIKKDELLDLAFVQIDPTLIKKAGLVPIELGELNGDEAQQFESVISIGYKDELLHAVIGEHTKRDWPNTRLDGNQVNCKTAELSETYPGMSGGPVCDQNGKLKYIINGGKSGKVSLTILTPIDLIKDAYLSLYPERAKKRGITSQTSLSVKRPECRFDAGDFRAQP